MGKSTGFLDYERKTGPVSAPGERIKNFRDFHGALSEEQQRLQGARCMECGVPFCQAGVMIAGMASGCPLHNLVPEINDLVYRGNWEQAYIRLSKTHCFPEFTSRVCPALCEAACTCDLHGEPVSTKENEKAVIEYAFSKGLVKADSPRVRTGKTVAVIGSGPAGLGAAIYGKRAGLSVLVAEKEYMGTGQIAESGQVDNYLGLVGKSGYDLGEIFLEDAKKLGVEFYEGEAVAFEKKENSWSVSFENGEVIKAKTVIYGAGAKHRPLGLPEEADYAGKGISYCAICDGAFYKGKTAVVVGGGDTALDDALYLSDICTRVYLVHRRDEFRGSARTLQKIREKENITVITNAVITAVSGEKKVEEVTLNNGTKLKTDGVFVAVGMIPHTEHLKDFLELDTQGYVVADETGKTSQDGFFVAGDVRTKHLRQVITAVADGANAAVSASEYIRQL